MRFWSAQASGGRPRASSCTAATGCPPQRCSGSPAPRPPAVRAAIIDCSGPPNPAVHAAIIDSCTGPNHLGPRPPSTPHRRSLALCAPIPSSPCTNALSLSRSACGAQGGAGRPFPDGRAGLGRALHTRRDGARSQRERDGIRQRLRCLFVAAQWRPKTSAGARPKRDGGGRGGGVRQRLRRLFGASSRATKEMACKAASDSGGCTSSL